MRFLADRGVDVRIVASLKQQGHDASHLRDQGLHRLPDGGVFDKAIDEARIILRFDLDFGETAAFSRGRTAGVILFRLRNARTSHVIDRLANVRLRSREALERGAVVIVEETRHRVRSLPIGEG